MIVSSGSWVCTVLTRAGLQQARRRMIQLKMKIASLGLAGGRSYDRTNSLPTPTMKESQLLREKTTSSRSFFQHVQTLCMPSVIDLHTHATPGHVTSFVCSRNTSDRWHDHATGEDLRARRVDRDRGET